jgi:hypothetical protein
VNVAAPSGDIVGERHVRLLTRFMRKGRTIVQKRMRSSMDGEFVEKPITIGTLMNKTFNNGVRGGKTREATLNATDKEVRKSGLNLGLNMRGKKIKPDAKRTVRTKGVKRRNEATIILGVLNNTIPPVGKVGDSGGIKDGKLRLELFLVPRIKTVSGDVGNIRGPIQRGFTFILTNFKCSVEIFTLKCELSTFFCRFQMSDQIYRNIT